MGSGGLTEARALGILRQELPRFGARTLVGLGDDAAVLEVGARRQVWTIDACVEGVHFERSWLSMEDLAHKAIEAAVSDVCAMGARPSGVLVQLTLAPWLTPGLLRRLAREQAATARRLGAPIVGGNLTAGRQLELVTTALGELDGAPLLRSGAQAGDEVWLVGEVAARIWGYLPCKGAFCGSGTSPTACGPSGDRRRSSPKGAPWRGVRALAWTSPMACAATCHGWRRRAGWGWCSKLRVSSASRIEPSSGPPRNSGSTPWRLCSRAARTTPSWLLGRARSAPASLASLVEWKQAAARGSKASRAGRVCVAASSIERAAAAAEDDHFSLVGSPRRAARLSSVSARRRAALDPQRGAPCAPWAP